MTSAVKSSGLDEVTNLKSDLKNKMPVWRGSMTGRRACHDGFTRFFVCPEIQNVKGRMIRVLLYFAFPQIVKTFGQAQGIISTINMHHNSGGVLPRGRQPPLTECICDRDESPFVSLPFSCQMLLVLSREEAY